MLALVLGSSACGGGHVDAGFGGEIAEEAPRRAAPVELAPHTEGKPAVVVIRSDSCKPCKRMELVFYPAYEPFRSEVELFVLDVSDDAHEAAARDQARALGIEEFFEEHRGVTPTIGLLTKHGALTHYTGNTFGRRSWERTFEAMVDDAGR